MAAANAPITMKDAHTVTKKKTISMRKAADIIGVGGTNLADIGRRSGAILTVQETKGPHNEIAVVMEGTSSQVETAKQLLCIQIKTIKDRDRPAVLNKPTCHPQDGTATATETPVEPQKEPMVCSSLLQVPQSRHRPVSHVTTAPSVMENIKESEQNKRKKFHHNFAGGPSETKRTMSVFEEEVLGVLKMIAEKMNKPEPPTFEDCEKKLNELGWPKDDPLHEVAFAIFCDKKYRECWMKLHPERCAKWVRMIGRSKSYL